jgi:hypothetical protein
MHQFYASKCSSNSSKRNPIGMNEPNTHAIAKVEVSNGRTTNTSLVSKENFGAAEFGAGESTFWSIVPIKPSIHP